jgi:transposase
VDAVAMDDSPFCGPGLVGARLIGQHLGILEDLERRIEAFDNRIADVLAPFRHLVELLMTIPGVSRVSAEIIRAEIGFDMAPFPTAGHLLSWAGVVPRLDESAGKRRSTRVRHGAPWLKPVLAQCGWTASRAKGTYLQAQFYRLKARRGPKKAVIAVAASILTAVYHMLKTTCRTKTSAQTNSSNAMQSGSLASSPNASRTSDMMSNTASLPDRNLPSQTSPI